MPTHHREAQRILTRAREPNVRSWGEPDTHRDGGNDVNDPSETKAAQRGAFLSGALVLRKPTTGIAGCCARAMSGQTAAATPSVAMNSRRRIRIAT